MTDLVPPMIVADRRQIRFVAGGYAATVAATAGGASAVDDAFAAAMAGMGATLVGDADGTVIPNTADPTKVSFESTFAVSENSSSFASKLPCTAAPSVVVPYEVAKASSTVTNIVEMLEAMGGAADGGGMFAGSGGEEDQNTNNATDEEKQKKDEAEAPKEHVITIDIEGPLAPTQPVLDVISEYLLMHYKRAFTEVPRTVREPVLDTLRPEEAKFLKDRILNVNDQGKPIKSGGSRGAGGEAGVNGGGAGSEGLDGAAPNSTPTLLAATFGNLLGGVVGSGNDSVDGVSNAGGASIANGSEASHERAAGLGRGAASPSGAAADNKPTHLFKLQVLRTALFLQLGPLAAAISGWFAYEMTKLVNDQHKATRNAERLRAFLGVEEDFNPEEKAIIERHTTWPGRN